MSTNVSIQSDAVYDGLSGFYKSVSEAIDSATSVPNIGSIASSLDFTDLQTSANLNSKGSPSFAVGSAVETTHLAAAVLREYGIRVKGKAEYYSDGVTDHARESDYYDKLKYMNRTALLGGNVNGSLTQ